MPRVKPLVKERIVYRDKPGWFTLDNIGMIKQWFAAVAPVVIAGYVWVIPQIEAKAAEYLRGQLNTLGINVENIVELNRSLEELKKESEDREKVLEGLKGDIGKIIIILEQQQKQLIFPPVQMQAAPPPMPLNAPTSP